MDSTCTTPDCDKPIKVKSRGLCQSHYSKWQHARHRDKNLERNAAWRARNPEYWRNKDPEVKRVADERYRERPEIREKRAQRERDRRAREGYEMNERRRERRKNFTDEQRQAESARCKAWATANPERVREHAIQATHRRRARGEVRKFELSEVTRLYGTDCHLCLEPIDMEAPRKAGTEGWERSFWIDHVIPLALGGAHSLENVRPSHAICNIRKGWRG